MTKKTPGASIITLKDGPHRVEPPTANAYITLEGLGYSYNDAFEAMGLALDKAALTKQITKAMSEHAKALKTDPDAPLPKTTYELSVKAVRDHLAALLADSGEDVTPEEVGKLLDLKRLSEYGQQITALGASAPLA